MNNLYFIILAILVIIYVFNIVRKSKFSIKESFWWVMASLLMFLLALFPYSIDKFANYLNIAYPPSLLFVICIIFLLFILFRNSMKIFELQTRVIEMGQELAILKEKVNGKKK